MRAGQVLGLARQAKTVRRGPIRKTAWREAYPLYVPFPNLKILSDGETGDNQGDESRSYGLLTLKNNGVPPMATGAEGLAVPMLVHPAEPSAKEVDSCST